MFLAEESEGKNGKERKGSPDREWEGGSSQSFGGIDPFTLTDSYSCVCWMHDWGVREFHASFPFSSGMDVRV